jgi:hypothetical protein
MLRLRHLRGIRENVYAYPTFSSDIRHMLGRT